MENIVEKKVLYKYREVNNYTLNLLKNSELYFSFPHHFNDPYDCFIKSDYHGDETDWINYFNRLNIDKSKKEKIFNFVKNLNFDKDKIIKTYPEVINDNFNDLLVLYCLTNNPKSIIMWSHYANNHKGICLGFKTLMWKDKTQPDKELHVIEMGETIIKDPKNGDFQHAPIYKVNYSHDFPILYNGLKESPKGIYRFLETKSKCWEYEDEYRSIVLFEDVKKQTLKFDKSILSEVILGLRTDENDEYKIQDLIETEYNKKGINVKLKKAIQVQDKYELIFKDLN